jgi:hypothetical protein
MNPERQAGWQEAIDWLLACAAKKHPTFGGRYDQAVAADMQAELDRRKTGKSV